mgnify:CR=1 FL=1
MNRVTVIIEADHGDLGQHRAEVSATFDVPDFDKNKVLDVFESALLAAGYACPIGALRIDDKERP